MAVANLYEYAYRVVFFNILKAWPAFNGFDFIFDEKEKIKGRVETHFRIARETLDKNPLYAGKLNKSVFRDDRKVVPLQAADLLAYEMRRHTWMRLEGRDTIRPAYARIKDAFAAHPKQAPYRQRLFRCYDKRFLIAVAEEVQRNPPASEADLIDLWYHHDAPED